MRLSSLISISNMFMNRFEINRKRTNLFSRPLHIALEPTLKCNSDCVMCNRNFSRHETKKAGRFVFTYTNAILMTEEIGRELVDAGMDRICVSIGGATREAYRKIRGVDKHDRVMENLKLIRDYKKKKGVAKPAIFLEVVAMNSVLPELE